MSASSKEYLQALEYVDELLDLYDAQTASLRAQLEDFPQFDTHNRMQLENRIAGSVTVASRLRHVRIVLTDALARRSRRRGGTGGA